MAATGLDGVSAVLTRIASPGGPVVKKLTKRDILLILLWPLVALAFI